VQALVTAAGVVVLTVILAYVQKLSEAKADDAKAAPAPSAFIHGESATLTAIDTGPTLSDLLAVMDVLREWSAATAKPSAPPEPPPATIADRIVTATPPILSADGPVKRSHHAGKAPPVVAPIDVSSDH
jgi:hypothetical protein